MIRSLQFFSLFPLHPDDQRHEQHMMIPPFPSAALQNAGVNTHSKTFSLASNRVVAKWRQESLGMIKSKLLKLGKPARPFLKSFDFSGKNVLASTHFKRLLKGGLDIDVGHTESQV